jgi:hypothetical protein
VGVVSFDSGLGLARTESGGNGAASGTDSFGAGLPKKSGGRGASSALAGGLETVVGEYSDPDDEELK